MTHKTPGLISFIIFCVYTILSLLLVTTGITVYRNIVARGDETGSLRQSMGYIANRLRSNDIENSISIEDRGGINTLVMKYEGGDDCETLIYFTDNRLYEMLKFTDSEISPEYGTAICSLESFEMSMDGQAVTFRATDTYGQQLSMTCSLRSSQGD